MAEPPSSREHRIECAIWQAARCIHETEAIEVIRAWHNDPRHSSEWGWPRLIRWYFQQLAETPSAMEGGKC